jgi:membrane protein implicated in regulation of membrane protease activity
MVPWWGWMVLGALLLCVELFAIDAQFYLIFIGAGAIVVGLIGLGVDLPGWTQWLLFAVLSLTAMFTIREQVYERMKGRARGFQPAGNGDRVTIAEELAPGSSCQVQYRGSSWTAVNVGDGAIPSGAEAVIDTIDGVSLKVRPIA